jgi:hypothetical protein
VPESTGPRGRGVARGGVVPPASGPISSSDGAAARVRALARLLDSAVRVPGTNVRVGLDALVGLVPGIGDVASAAFSGYIILAAARLGAPKTVLLRMLLNVATDTVVGAVPVVGDLFDVGWRANARNAALLDRHLAAPAATRAASRWVVAAVVGGVALLAIGAAAVAVVAVRALAGLVG